MIVGGLVIAGIIVLIAAVADWQSLEVFYADLKTGKVTLAALSRLVSTAIGVLVFNGVLGMALIVYWNWFMGRGSYRPENRATAPEQGQV